MNYGKRPGAALDLYVLIAYQMECLGSFSLLNVSKQGQATDVRQALKLLFTAVQNVQDVTTELRDQQPFYCAPNFSSFLDRRHEVGP